MRRATLDQLDDPELLDMARAAPQTGAFRVLVERHQQELFGFLTRLLRDTSLAEDALQETFLQLYRFMDRYDPKQAFRPWLYQIARNTGLNVLRKHTKSAEGSLDAPPGSSGPGDVIAQVAKQEAIGDTRRALGDLEHETRALLVERHGLQLKLSELATSYEVTERTVRNRLHAACDQLARAILARRHQGGQS